MRPSTSTALLIAWIGFPTEGIAQTAPPAASAPVETPDPAAPTGSASSAATTPSPPPAQAPRAPDTASACDPTWVQRVHNQVRGAIVKIESVGGMGAGFVFHSPKHVATAFHVVDTGRSLVVTSPGGTERAARVIAIAPKYDLAILELDTPFADGARPLVPSTDGPAVGTPVAAIGHPFGAADQFGGQLEGLLSWSTTTGVVSGASPDYIQTDAAINPGNSGGPLLGCDGRLMGVVSEKLMAAEGISLAVSVSHLVKLEGEIGKQEEFSGTWTFGHPSFGLLIEHEPGLNWTGPLLGIGAIWGDRWAIRTQLAFLWGAPASEDSPLETNHRSRLQADATLGYRILLTSGTLPIYAVPSLGGVLVSDSISSTRLDLRLADPACDGTTVPCSVVGTPVESDADDKRVMPLAGLDLSIGGLDVGYGYMLDTGDTSRSNHRFFVGFAF